MKLTQQQREKLWKDFSGHQGRPQVALMEILDGVEEIFNSGVKIPRWRDPVLDPPQCGDLDVDGEVVVLSPSGDVVCTDPSRLPAGCFWMCRADLAALPRKDYSALKLAEERRKFEDFFRVNLNLSSRGDRGYVDPQTQAAFQGWMSRAELEVG